MQAGNCAYSELVVGLDLQNINLQGCLPADVSMLPLQFLNVQDNPGLRGSLPSTYSNDLFDINIVNTAMNCHNDTLSDAEVVATAALLAELATDDDAWTAPEIDAIRDAALDWTPGAQRCVAAFGVTDTDFNVTIATGVRCVAIIFRDTSALLEPMYALAAGCECPRRLRKVYRSSGGRLSVLCTEYDFMWIIEGAAFWLSVIYMLAVVLRAVDRHRSFFRKWVKFHSQPGLLQLEGGVRRSLYVPPSAPSCSARRRCNHSVHGAGGKLVPRRAGHAINSAASLVARDGSEFCRHVLHQGS